MITLKMTSEMHTFLYILKIKSLEESLTLACDRADIC